MRLWEVAGTAHADTYSLVVGPGDLGASPDVVGLVITASPIPGLIDCGSPINSGPQHFVGKAAFAALERWVRRGKAPKPAPKKLATKTILKLLLNAWLTLKEQSRICLNLNI